MFWTQWKHDYLPTLQSHRRWTEECRNLQEGDAVLLKDGHAGWNAWLMALVTSAFQSQDGKVRNVEMRTTAQGSPKTFLRPISEVVLLLPVED